MKIVIDIDEKDYRTIEDYADFLIHENSSYGKLVSRIFRSVKTSTSQTIDMCIKDLCEYRDILDKTVNSLDNIKRGDFLYGRWLAYSDCLCMINGIIDKYKEVE